MAKFTTDYVNLIATNLRDRYKNGFPILKELVQNADDAGATTLAFGYHEGFAGVAAHELLQGPALWILNDGRFEARDRQAIRSFGVNSKAAETGAIGKFGLGMKSVFHLCEAFFYVASDGTQDYHEVLSPWFQDAGSHDKHDSWEEVAGHDIDAIESVARAHPSVQPGRSWFMLWVPLRRRSHVPSVDGDPTAPIIDSYPGDGAEGELDIFSEPGIDKRIGRVLPLLRHVQQVQFAGTSKLAPFDLRLELAEGTMRLDHATDGLVARGTIQDGGPKGQRLHFMALQAARNGSQPFASMQEAPAWPKSNAIVASGKRVPVADKGQPEGAVMVSHADGRRGQLSVQWAVFLPTEEVRFRYEAEIPGTSREFNIILHGQFFVDAGRRGIEGMERLADRMAGATAGIDDALLQSTWNQALAQQVVLPMVLPAIARYVQAEGLGDEHVAALTDALVRCSATGDSGTKVSFAGAFLPHVYREHAWVRVLRPAGAAWELLPAGVATLLLLPRPVDRDRERPWRVLPGLRRLPGVTFVDASAPRASPPVDAWDEHQVCAALDSLPAASLCSEASLKYLLEFLGMHRQVALNTGLVRSKLVRRVRRALGECELDDLRAQRQLFRQLVGMLPRELWHGIGTRGSDAKGSVPEGLFKRLAAVDTEALLLPADLVPEGEEGQPAITDIGAWLACTGSLAGQGIEVSRCLDLAESLLGAVDSDRQRQADLLRRHPRLRLLRAIDVRANKELACSLHDLLDAHAKGQLFRTVDPKDRLGLAKDLAQAVPGLELLVVRPAVGQYVQGAMLPGGEDLPPTNSATAMFRTIGEQRSAPQLCGEALRHRLLDHVGSADLAIEAVRTGVRYLLHGSPGHFKAPGVLWKDPSGRNSPWVRLWSMVSEDSWNVLPSQLSSLVPDRCSLALDIKPVDQSTVTARLRQAVDFGLVDASAFAPSDIDSILGHLDDQATWRKLPLHLDTNGSHGPLDGTCYIGDEPCLPPGLAARLRFIVESANEAHRRQQLAYIDRWTPGTAAAIVLQSGSASIHWRYLMDMLPGLARHGGLAMAWREVDWLPTRAGTSISPARLVHLDGLGKDTSFLSAACNHAYAGVAELADEVRAHPSFDMLQGLIPSGRDALPGVARMMAGAGLSVGRRVAGTVPSLDRHLVVLSGLRSLPAWELLAKIAGATSIDDARQHVLPAIATPLAREEAERVLAELAGKHDGHQVRELFLAYLEEWAASATAEELRLHLPSLHLLAADGTWQPASMLAEGAHGIVEASEVDRGVGKALSGIIVSNANSRPPCIDDDEEGPGEVAAGLALALEKWSDSFAQSSIRPALGALIGLFGTGAAALAETWIAPISYEDYLFKLNWKDPGYEEGIARRLAWMGGHKSPARPFALLKPTFLETQETGVRAWSLTGEELVLPLASEEDLSTMVVGQLRWLGGTAVEVRMRPVECLRAYGPRQQKAILQRTAEALLRELYNQQEANLSGLWNLFEEADQVELDVARTMILEGLPQLMNQLSTVKRHPLVAGALASIDKARRDKASAERAGSDPQLARQRITDGIDRLVHLVEDDASVQDALLDAIRQKLRRFQYEPSSIPFELLQNADDAVVEYQAMQLAEGGRPFDQAEIGRFIVERAGDGLVLVHWGRPVNHVGRRERCRQDYALDLEHMLVLGASAKELDHGVTGKFGLGFKSVFLATDSPVVESGDLRFGVVAGCLPQRASFSAAAEAVAGRHRRTVLRPTIIELPDAANPGAALRRFGALAGMCVLFSRQVKRISIGADEHRWAPSRLLGTAEAWCELGSASLPHKSGLVPSRLLALRSTQGDVVVRVDGVPVAFDHEAGEAVPAIWVHSPTRGTPARGLVLNAGFDIDAGRSSLPQGGAAHRNRELALALADTVAPVLAELIELSRAGWDTWAPRLEAGPGTSAAAYWHAFWVAAFMTEAAEDASQDSRLVALHASRLLDRVVAASGIVPNGLPGGLAAFAGVADIRLAVRSDRLGQVLPALLAWPRFLETYPLSSWCGFDVASWLDARSETQGGTRLRELDRAALVEALGDTRQLDPDDVDALAAIIGAWPKGHTEDMGWRSELAALRLRSRSGNWRPAGGLHFPGGELDGLLASFVPEEALLDSAYEAQAGWQVVRPYLASRMLAAGELAGWCAGAESDGAREAVVDWLARNLDWLALWAYVRMSTYPGNWLLGLEPGDPLLDHHPHEVQVLLLARLGIGLDEGNAPDSSQEEEQEELTLAAIHGWWMANRELHVPDYDEALWPQRIDRSRLAADEVDRDTWMTLFSLGAFKRFGRVREEQNRGFLDFLHVRGWWQTISEVHPRNGAEEWMSILREYAETSQVSAEFEHWMDSFASLFRLANWCDEYVGLFRNLELRNRQDARHLLTPWEDASLNGSGIDLPTLRRTLRIGHNLVIRELLRAGVLRSEVSQSKAFMPGQAVLDLFRQLGYHDLQDSEDIHAVLMDELGSLEAASFGGDYDIPLILLATNPGLRAQVAEWDGEGPGPGFDLEGEAA